MGSIPFALAMRTLSGLLFDHIIIVLYMNNIQTVNIYCFKIQNMYVLHACRNTKVHKCMVAKFLAAQMKQVYKRCQSSVTIQSKMSVRRASRNSTSLLTPLSPPTQLPAATLSPHHCQCHCHHHAQHVPTLLLTFPLTKPGPWGFSCRLFWDTTVELSGKSKPCSAAAGEPLYSSLL